MCVYSLYTRSFAQSTRFSELRMHGIDTATIMPHESVTCIHSWDVRM